MQNIGQYLKNKNGYIYVLTNPIFSVYDNQIYKIGSSKYADIQIDNINKKYLEPCSTIKVIKVNDKNYYEKIITGILDNYRFKKKYFTNIEMIVKVFNYIEDKIKYSEKINTDKIKNNNIMTFDLVNETKINLEKIKQCTKDGEHKLYTDLVHSSCVEGHLYFLHLDIIEKYYKNNIHMLYIAEQRVMNKNVFFTTFYIDNPKIIKKIHVSDINLAKSFLSIMMHKYNIIFPFYKCNVELVTDVVDIIDYYFSNNALKNLKNIFLNDILYINKLYTIVDFDDELFIKCIIDKPQKFIKIINKIYIVESMTDDISKKKYSLLINRFRMLTCNYVVEPFISN